MRATVFALLLVSPVAEYPTGNWESDLVTNGMNSCSRRSASNLNLYEARDPATPQGRGGEYFQRTGGNWALQGRYSIRNCFRDTAPTSQLAQAFRTWNFGRMPENGPDPDNDAFHREIKHCQDTKWSNGPSWCRNGGGGESTFYAIAKETDGTLPQKYWNAKPDYVLAAPDGTGVPPPMKTAAEGHDGSTRSKPVWHDDGCEFPVMAGADLYMCGQKDKGVPPGVYKVPGELVRTGSHTICAAFEYFAHTQPGGEIDMNNPRRRVAVIPGRWERAPMEWLLNYGAPGPAQKAMWWIHHKYKFWWGNQDQGHPSYVGTPLVQKAGHMKDTTYRRQLMCTVYDSFNAWLQVYVNGVLYGERNMNMYDHLNGVSNQWGNMIDVYEPDLYVGKAPTHQHSTADTHRFTNILGDANEMGHDFVGEFTMVGVWNNYVMTEAEAARMAGIEGTAVPQMTVSKIPVHRPAQFAMTPREATGITDAQQPQLTDSDYLSTPPSTPKNMIPNSGKDTPGNAFSSTLIPTPSPTTSIGTTTAPVSSGNSVIENAPGVGRWGGSCICPDGTEFQVGDNGDFCGSLACVGGTPGTCHRRTGVWSKRKVLCAGASTTTTTTTSASHSHRVIENAPGVGGWGGSCTCPDGSEFQVGDNGDFCKSLACVGGTAGTCHRSIGVWSKRAVVCDQGVQSGGRRLAEPLQDASLDMLIV